MAEQDTSFADESDSQAEWNEYEAARRLQVGRFFDQELRKKGMTQAQLAERAKCSQTMVSKICNGRVHASPGLIKRLLTALALPLDSIEKLPGLGFDPGSDGFRLKIAIIRALVANEIPSGPNVDAREYIENEWNNPVYREAPRSSNLDDAVWASLAADNYFEVDDQGRYVPRPMYYDLKGNLLLYVAAMAAAMATVRNLPVEHRARALAGFDRALSAWKESLDKPDQLAAAIDACSYSLAAGDRMLAAALLGHAAALRFFLEVGSSVVAGSAEHFAVIVMPFFDAIMQTLRKARDQMVSQDASPADGILAFLGQRIDAILDLWRASGRVATAADSTPTREAGR